MLLRLIDGADFDFCLQREDKMVLKHKHGEFWLEVKNSTLFTVVQYEGFKDQHYICFHTSNICMYHQGNHNTHPHTHPSNVCVSL